MASVVDSQIKEYEKARKQLQGQLSTMPSAYGTYGEPSDRAVETERQLKDIQKQLKNLKATKREAAWYGTEAEQKARLARVGTKKEKQEGLISKGLNALSIPLYGVVGAVETALGKGSKKGLWENIKANVKERGSFGALLRSYKLPGWTSVPLGFALDVALDPVNWATMGTAALVPKLGVGAWRAGATGVTRGLEAWGLGKAATLAKYTPVLRKTTQYEQLATKAVEAGTAYNELVGRDVKDVLQRALENPSIYRNIGLPWVEKALNKTPAGRKVVGFFKPRNAEWFNDMKNLDNLDNARRGFAGEVRGQPKFYGTEGIPLADIPGATKETLNGVSKPKSIMEAFSSSFDDAAGTPLGTLRNQVDEGAQLATDYAHLGRATIGNDWNYRMAGEAAADREYRNAIQEVLNKYSSERTGVGKIDELFRKTEKIKIGNFAIGEKFLRGYDTFISLFKHSKITGSPSAFTNAIIGNGTMTLMSGIDPSLSLFQKIRQSSKLIAGKKPDAEFLGKILSDPQWGKYLQQYPGLFRHAFGFDPKFMAGRQYLDNVADVALQQMKNKKQYLNSYEASADMEAMRAMIDETMAKIPKAEGAVETLMGRGMQESGIPGSLISYEIYKSGFNDLVKKISAKADEGNKLAKVLKWYFTKPMDAYENIDQSFKFGMALHLSQTGISERELMRLKNVVKIGAQDVVDTGKGLYRLTPERATEAALETYMNYASMPAAVKVLRSLPFFGMPFASFAYSMGVKMGKTLKYNPSAYNKVNQLINEMNGGRSPLERQALKEPYYQWLNQGGMVRLPFFQQNPVYLNVASMIPYYTMNIFEPSERRYLDDPAMDKLTQIKDRMPFFQTPETQIMWDYFIQPLLLERSNPKGLFDQPLYPTDASALAKYVGYPSRSLAETVVPPALGAAGIATGLATPGVTDYLPSYRWRQLANAVQGLSSVGTPVKEPATTKTLRTLGAMLGIPLYSIQPQYKSTQKKP